MATAPQPARTVAVAGVGYHFLLRVLALVLFLVGLILVLADGSPKWEQLCLFGGLAALTASLL